MPDEDLTISAGGEPAPQTIATPEMPIEEIEVPRDVDAPGDDPASDETYSGDDEAEEFDEIELNGKKYQVHKDLKDGYLMHSDYTRKTQELAEKTRDFEAKLASTETADEEDLNDRAMLRQAKAALAKYDNVDWVGWHQQDPFAKGEHETYVRQLEKQIAATEAKVAARQTTRSQEQQADFAKRAEETHEFARKNIPGWTPETGTKLLDFAISKGVPQKFLRDSFGPTLIEILHLASLGEQVIRNKQTTAKTPAPPPAPLAIVGSKANPPVRTNLRDLAKSDNVDAYAAMRAKQMAAAKRR